MTHYEIPYGPDSLSVQVADKNFLYYAATKAVDNIPKQQEVIQQAFVNPIGTPHLEEMVQSDMTVAIMMDDITRPTPKRVLLKEVLSRLEAVGVPDKNITLIVALGTHRTLTDEEISTHYGDDVIRRYRFLNMDYKDTSIFVDLAVSENGTPIQVYREVVEADFKIAIGNIVPHIAAGWGGGGKMFQPGVCSEKTTEVTHLLACTIQNVLEACGTTDNLCRLEMEKIAGEVGLDFIVNTVLDEKKNMVGLFCGHYIKAHHADVALATEVMRPKIPAKADIVIVSTNPADIDFWQGCKPYIFAHFGVREGGVIIYAIHAREGLCGNAPQHDYTVRKYSSMPFDDIKADVDAGLVEDIVGINVPLFVATMSGRNTVLCVSEGLQTEDIEALGFTPSNNIEDALAKAYELLGEDATVGIIPFCGETLVRTEQPLLVVSHKITTNKLKITILGDFTMKLRAIVLDSDNFRELAEFYVKLLGGTLQRCTKDYAAVVFPKSDIIYYFQTAANYSPPVWPEEVNKQQQMIHMDYVTGNVEQAVEHALSCGASLAPTQFLDNSTVLLDPAGHPFCIGLGG